MTETINIPFIATNAQYAPTKAHTIDAAADLRVAETVTINPGETQLVSSGLRLDIPEGYVGKIYVRSSTGVKSHVSLANGTGIIDAGYQGDIKLALYNFGSEQVTFQAGDRVAQLILDQVLPVNYVPTDAFMLSERGEGGFGSTGKN